MSKAINQSFQDWETVWQSVWRHKFMYGDRYLFRKDNILVQDCVVLLSMVWCECFTPSSLCSVPRWIPRWIKTIEGISWDRTARFFKACDDLLLSFFLGEERDPIIASYDDFKRHLRGECEYAGDLLSPAREVIDSFFRFHDEGSAFLLHQAFAFPSRTSLRNVPEIANAMLQKFVDNCDRVANFCYDYSDSTEKDTIQRWFREEPNWEYFQCKHGSGAVAEPKVVSIAEKYHQPGPDKLLQYVIRSRGLELEWPFSGATLHRRARVELVPKSSTTFRTITMEPSCLMYAQQGVRKLLVEYIHGHRELSKHINLADQTASRRLCNFSSVDGEYVTIDLSMASDSISMELLREWFRGTWLYPLLIGSRSTTVLLPDGETMTLPFYAGMGNATTFPVQCVIYSAMCEAAIAEVGPRPHEIPYRVYGDDIIIHRRYAQALMQRLHRRGFIVNRDKSYYSRSPYGIFRESCGAESLNGNDVKPVRLPRKFRSFRPGIILSRPELYGNLIDLANAFNEKHLRLPYLWLIHCLNELPTCLRPLFGRGDSMLHSDYGCNNHQIQILWSNDYYSRIALHGSVQSVRRRKKKNKDEDVRLFETLRTMRYRLDCESSSEPITVRRPNPLALEATETILSSR
mgnify:CR=1 FL=1